MSTYFPQVVMEITALWEDYKRGSARDSKAGSNKFTVTPHQVSVSINDYRTADTFSCELDYKNFPFDPRSIRSMQVTIYVEDMKSLQTGANRIKPREETVIFAGFADEASIELDEDDRLVKFSGRDQTSILIDTRWDGTLVDLGNEKLDSILKRILGKLDSTRDLKFQNRTGGALPTLSQIPGGFGESAGGQESELRKKRNSKVNESYWDVIQDLVGKAGLIAYIEIDTLVVTKPNALYEKADSKQFVYGHNVSLLEMKRKIGRLKDINLKLVSMNPRLANPVIECFIPMDATPEFKKRLKLPDGHIMVERVNVDGEKEKEPEPAPVIAFNIPRAPSRTRLIEIGEGIFEEMSRQQIEGKLKTGEMLTRDRNGLEFDLTKLRIGTPIEIRIDNHDLVGMRDVDSEDDRRNYLIRRGYESRVADYLAKAYTGFESPFYTKSVEISVGADHGFELTVEFINFIELKEELLRP